MYGAILGDIIGSPFEFDKGKKTKDFKLFSKHSRFTDDTVMTVAIAEALLKAGDDASVAEIKEACIDSMKAWGKKYPNCGFGGRFVSWVLGDDRKPYNSYGNGSAMRVSAAGWLYDTIERTREVARATAEVTHNHPEGIKGAEATVAVIYMARNGASKEEIRKYVETEFEYNLDRTLDEIRPTYHHVEDCMRTVPEAIISLLEGNDFEDTIRNAVSLGGDADTLGAIAGAMAEAMYGVPGELVIEARKKMDPEMWDVIEKLDFTIGDNTYLELFLNHTLDDWTELNLKHSLSLLRDSILWVPCNAVFSDADMDAVKAKVEAAGENLESLIGEEFHNEEQIRLVPDILQNGDEYFFPAFTTSEIAGEYAMHFSMIPVDMLSIINLARNNEKKVKGVVINAFSKPFEVPMGVCEIIEKTKSRIGR